MPLLNVFKIWANRVFASSKTRGFDENGKNDECTSCAHKQWVCYWQIKEEKGAQTQTFCVRISSDGMGVFVNGWGPKSSVCPSKPRKTQLLGGNRHRRGISRDFGWDVPGAHEKFEKKKLCSFLSPKTKTKVTKMARVTRERGNRALVIV